MAELTETNFYSKWIQEFRTRGDAGITGEMMGEFMDDISDSCVFKSTMSSGGSDPLYPDIIDVDDLDENNVATITHNLGTLNPLIAIWNSSNQLLNGMNYSVEVIDSNTIEITFEDPPEEGLPCAILVWRKVTSIDIYRDYIDYLTDNFENWGGTGYATYPVGWSVYTTLGDGTPEDHLDINHNISDNDGNGALFTNYDTGTEYILVLEIDRYVENLETYRVQFYYEVLDGGDVNIKIFNQDILLSPGDGERHSFDQNIQAGAEIKFTITVSSDEDQRFSIDELIVTKL